MDRVWAILCIKPIPCQTLMKCKFIRKKNNSPGVQTT